MSVGSTAKRLIRRALQRGLAPLAPLAWRGRNRALLVLMYHRVLPADHPDRSLEQPGMFVSPESLQMHLGVLKKYFTLLHLEEWLDLVAKGKPVPRRACCITFDDGWRDNYEYAFPILQREQAPATIYLVTDLVGSTYSFWPNVLSRWLGSAPLSNSVLPPWLAAAYPEILAQPPVVDVDRVIAACKRLYTDRQMVAFTADLARAESRFRDLVSWPEVISMAASGLIKFGSHTRRHTRLTGTESAPDLRDEIVGSKEILLQRLGESTMTFCYPNGDLSPAALALVRETYSGAVTTQPGWNTSSSDVMTLRRVGLHEDMSATSDALLMRLAGWS